MAAQSGEIDSLCLGNGERAPVPRADPEKGEDISQGSVRNGKVLQKSEFQNATKNQISGIKTQVFNSVCRFNSKEITGVLVLISVQMVEAIFQLFEACYWE